MKRYCFLLFLFASEHLFPRCVCENVHDTASSLQIHVQYMHVQIVYGTHTHTHTHIPCLPDRADGRSPVRDTRTFPAYQTAQMADRRSGTHAHSLPTRPHRWQIAGQGHTHIPCLPDRTNGRSPVRESTYIY